MCFCSGDKEFKSNAFGTVLSVLLPTGILTISSANNDRARKPEQGAPCDSSLDLFFHHWDKYMRHNFSLPKANFLVPESRAIVRRRSVLNTAIARK